MFQRTIIRDMVVILIGDCKIIMAMICLHVPVRCMVRFVLSSEFMLHPLIQCRVILLKDRPLHLLWVYFPTKGSFHQINVNMIHINMSFGPVVRNTGFLQKIYSTLVY